MSLPLSTLGTRGRRSAGGGIITQGLMAAQPSVFPALAQLQVLQHLPPWPYFSPHSCKLVACSAKTIRCNICPTQLSMGL